MIFHLVAIREFFDQKFTIDVLVFWVSEKFLREICSEYKLVVLELYEYNKEKVESFWKIKMLLNYNETDVILLSNASDLEGILYWFYVLWFNIVNINYVDDRKLDQEHVHNIIAQTKAEANAWLKEKKEEEKKASDKEEQMFNDQKLEKTLLIANKLVSKIPTLIKDAGDLLPKEELKELYKQWQELSKLKMWRNLEKLSGYLENVYNNYNKLEQEYLAAQKASRIKVSGSNVSDTYVASEMQKLEKARWMMQVSWKVKTEDTFYATFWNAWIYLKLLWKDIVAKSKELPQTFHKIFWYLDKLLCLLIIFTWIYFDIAKLFLNETNIYSYAMLIVFGIAGLMLYFVRMIKRKSFVYNILLLLAWAIVSLLLIIFLKRNFLF